MKKGNEKLTFGKLIVRLRRTKGLTQEELAFRSNLSTRAMVSIEKDEYYPGLEAFTRIAKKLDMKPSEIFKIIEDNGLLADWEKGTNDDHH
ncbi:helix-turn-helix transcriptional regulator [Paenibacillus sp. BSR1-1]|uniref:helix-turn-helix domain-containing protein n=1 Tax=Paenibacillus sp. BSR1-1 TaxID=3020845 RepID=UPI0025B0B147|nr:helix-turn-helix transcriptional regulator [Paenibacillus sp. BSR1-1]MDN3019209.1 helix-turn-helix transcriptional regulator [Paenibacillus sp. BSR1-1]